jgi:HEPN domain-containing protein
MTQELVEKTKAWLMKSRNDLTLAKGALSTLLPFDAGIYHCQQCAEKALKGFLLFNNLRFPKTHDIQSLIELAEIQEPLFTSYKPIANQLTDYATQYRYPDDLMILMPTAQEFEDAIQNAETIYTFVLSKLPNETHP